MADIGDYIQKLVHPIVEIRERTLNTLLQKVEFGILTVGDLIQHPNLTGNLLQLLDLGPHNLRKQLLKLLQYVFQDESSRKRFDDLGGTQYLQSLKLVAPVELVHDIKLLLQCLRHKSPAMDSYDPPMHSVTPALSASNGNNATTSSESVLYVPTNLGHQESNDTVIDDSCICDANSTNATVASDPAITFTTFPWQALTSSDRRVLESTTQSLLSHDESVVISSLHFLDTVILKDFPAEILLQRPAVLQAVYGCIEEEGETAWRVQGPACNAMLTLTQLLNDRVAHFKDPHLSPTGQQTVTPTSSGIASPSTDITRGSCCSSNGSLLGSNPLVPGHNIRHLGDGQDKSGSIGGLGQGLSSASVHEDDDGDEFILFGMHQVTVSGHCSRILKVACPHLIAKRSSLQSISLRLLLSSLNLLQKCVNPETLWNVIDEEEIVTEVISSLKRAVKQLCFQLIVNYEKRKQCGDSTVLEDPILSNQCVMLLLCKILRNFFPLDAFKQIIDQEISAALILVLCDGGFYLGYRSHHDFLFDYLGHVLPGIAAQLKCVLFAADALKATIEFLSTSSAQFDEFMSLAEGAVTVASIHQSSLYVEKLVRGIAKQVGLENAKGDQVERARRLLLKVLHSPDAVIKLAGYTSVLRLVEDNIGISQSLDTSQSRSTRVKILLSPSITSCVIYSGLTDDDDKVVTSSENILLGLMKGRLLMNAATWSVAAECWKKSLIHLRSLADTTSNLGLSVATLVDELYNDNVLYSLEILLFHLHCLYALDKQLRIQALSRVAQRLVLSTASFLPNPHEINPTVHHDLFIVRQPSQLLLSGNLGSERGRLVKVVELIQGVGIENSVRKAAWSQLAFLLEDPDLHKSFLQLFSLQYLVINFVGMMKRDGSMNLTVEFLPGALDVLKLLATHSTEIRLTLSKDEEFILCLVRVAFIYYADERTRGQAACLMALLLLNDILVFSCEISERNGIKAGRRGFVSLPELLVSKMHLPFICDSYIWYDKAGLRPEIRTLHQILQEEDWETMKFLKMVWASACQGGIENTTSENDKAAVLSVNLKLTKEEMTILELYVLKSSLNKFLLNVENGTSHHDVKKNLNLLSYHLLQSQLRTCSSDDYFIVNQWSQSLHRFLSCKPNSSVDEQLLTHVLTTIYVAIVCQRSQGKVTLTHLVLKEFMDSDTALHHTLKATGSVNWVASDPNPRALLSVRLFCFIAKLISLIVQTVLDLQCENNIFTQESYNQLARNVVLSILPVLRPSNEDEPQYYNLVVLGCALECLAHVTSLGWPGAEMSSRLVFCLTRIIKTFHDGRGRAHNSYMGRMITLSSSLTLTHLLSHPEGDLTQEISDWCNRSGSPDWSWLVSLWVYRDPSVTSAGLNVASALTMRPDGISLLHESLAQVSGGVWGAALSYVLATGRSCLVRTAAAELLINLTEIVPTPDEPWTSPIVTDTLSGESIEGVGALMILLQHCNFYSVMKASLSKLWIYPEQPCMASHAVPQPEWDFSISHLSSFYNPAEEEPVSTESQSNGEWETDKSSSLISVQLYETLLRLLTNIVLLQPSHVVNHLSSHGVILMVIKQLRYIIPLMNNTKYYLKSVETVLVLICTFLKHEPAQALSLGRDTSLVHLTMAVFTSGISNTNLKTVCCELLNALACRGRWGTLRIIEWIEASPALTLRPLVVSLHSCSPLELQSAAVSFLISLLHSVHKDEILQREKTEVNVASVLDTEVELLNSQDICPGWEISRHLIQLICYVSDIDNPNQSKEKENRCTPRDMEHQYLLVECLKLVLVSSNSAKAAAHHFRLFFMPELTKPFVALQEKVQTMNVHITSQLMNKKDLKELINEVIHHLELATNWVAVRGDWVDAVGESLVPILHCLWVATLRIPNLLTATLKFLLAVSAHHQVCLFLNRTSGLPGVLLSASRTSRPLLACITTYFCQPLSRLSNASCGSLQTLRDGLKENFQLSVSILTNCAKLQECTSVMIKHDLINVIMKWLDCKVAFDDGITITAAILRIFVMLLAHNESQMFVCKSRRWVSTFHEFLHHNQLQNDGLIATAIISQNNHAARSLLGSETFVKTLIGIVGNQESEESLKLALIIVWSLIANNKRGQAIIKQFPIQPTLKYFVEIGHTHTDICQKILKILAG